MAEMNATLFYKACIDVSSNLGAIPAQDLEKFDPFWRVVLKLRAWATHKYDDIPQDFQTWSKFKSGSNIGSSPDSIKSSFFAKSADFQSDARESLWSCRISERSTERDRAPRIWTSEYGLRFWDDHNFQFSCMIFYSDEPGFIGDCQDPPGISVPTVVRDLLRDPYFICKSGSVRLGIEPRRLIAEEVPDFVEALQDSARECPLVFISPLPGTEWVSLAIAQARVAEAVAANAVVYYGDSASVMAKMGDLLPEGYKVYGGALRIFMPKVDFQDPADQYRHRYISAAQVKERGQDGVLGILRRALAQDIRFFESKKFVRVETVETERRNDSHRLRLAQLNEKTERLQASEGDTQDALEMVETEEEKRLEAELELSLCQDELQELKGRLSVALSRIDAEEAFHRQARDKLVALDFIRNRLRDYPGEADSVGLFFEAVFKDQLAFTDRGRRSLVDCTTDPAVLWRALWVISHTVYDAYAQGLSVDDAVNNSTNFQYAHTEGKQTKKDQKLMDLRKDTFEGREIDISAHLKIGNKDNDPKSIRIYHCFDAESQKIVIGFCGGHLENYSSRKIK